MNALRRLARYAAAIAWGGLACALGPFGPSLAQEPAAGRIELAAIDRRAVVQTRRPELPAPLSAADAERYRQALRAAADGAFERAESLVAEAHSDLLAGHVEAAKLLHPTDHVSSYEELASWLERYPDHPQAVRIRKLASIRAPQGVEPPSIATGYLSGAGQSIGLQRAAPVAKPRDRAAQDAVDAWREAVRAALNEDDADAAVVLLGDRRARSLLSDQEFDAFASTVARALAGLGYVEAARELAQVAVERSGDALPRLHWVAGLTAWRRGDIASAAAHFEAERRHPATIDADRARAAFWAARARLKLGNAELVTGLLEAAAEHAGAFYGLLARDLLGAEVAGSGAARALDDEALGVLVRRPGARRAFALDQIGRGDLAEMEIRALAAGAPPDLSRALIALARKLGLPAAEMRVAQSLANQDVDALFPTPKFASTDATIDRALALAVMRAESGFRADSVSRAGALGLMQVMPATAVYVAKREGWRHQGPDSLLDPETNVRYGSSYIAHLMQTPDVDQDLVALAIAYNAGPSRLAEWRERFDFDRDDPLLFIESLPIGETRDYVKKVIGNLWFYRARLGQPTPSLRQLADQRIPQYVALDGREREFAENKTGR